MPLIALLIPLSRILPPLYNWRVRSRVYRWYGQLRAVETEIDAMDAESAGSSGDMTPDRQIRRAKYVARLDEIDAKVSRLVIPLSYANELYSLKQHIDRVRSKLLGH